MVKLMWIKVFLKGSNLPRNLNLNYSNLGGSKVFYDRITSTKEQPAYVCFNNLVNGIGNFKCPILN